MGPIWSVLQYIRSYGSSIVGCTSQISEQIIDIYSNKKFFYPLPDNLVNNNNKQFMVDANAIQKKHCVPQLIYQWAKIAYSFLART